MVLHLGDCLDILSTLPDASIDAIVTDPPYELGFMGRSWDGTGVAYNADVWRQCLRVLKPGGHLLAFGGSRTYHRMAMAVEDAGFEIRDSLHWIYGSGFPKGTSQLRPGHEPIIMARKPLVGTLTATIGRHGTGGLNIDGCRYGADADPAASRPDHEQSMHTPVGRWPTNVTLTHPPLQDDHGRPVGDACANGCADGCPVAEMDAQSGIRRTGGDVSGRDPSTPFTNTYGEIKTRVPHVKRRDVGGASRYFPVFRYQAKAPASERPRLADGTAWPTVKPLALMRWLVRLVTPPGGTVLDPFAGTGTTLQAAEAEGFVAIGIEKDETAAALCEVRLNNAERKAS